MNFFCASKSSFACPLIVSKNPLIETKGVLSSWLTFATKSDLNLCAFIISVKSFRNKTTESGSSTYEVGPENR